jgi:oligopeptide transport system permease protein
MSFFLKKLLPIGFLTILLLGSALVTQSNIKDLIWHPQMDQVLLGASWSHLFGTDALGRDLFLKTIAGAWLSISVSVLGAFLSLGIGIVVGVLVSFFSTRVDLIGMRIIELFTSLPPIIIAALLVMVIQSYSPNWGGQLYLFVIILGISNWTGFARQTRNLVLREKKFEYIQSSRLLGAGTFRIILKHIVPNIMPNLMVYLGLQIPSFLMFESFLSFVGLGVQVPQISWGLLMQEGWKGLNVYPHLVLGPGIFLFLTSLSLNLIFSNLKINERN